MKNILIILILVFAITTANAQGSVKKSRKELKAEKLSQQKEVVKKLIEGKSFVFDAKTVFSSLAGSITTTYPYNVRVDNDSIYSFLPYYGRAYIAEYGSIESPMVFNLPIEEITIEKKNKNGYQVNVKVKKAMDIIDFYFDISETGMTTLTVNSTNRQIIYYYGDLTDKKDVDNG